jgi:hypothetical protein
MRIIGYRESAESAKQTRLQTCQSNRDAQYPSFVSFSLVIIPYCTFSSISSGCIIFPIRYGSLPLDRMPTVSSHNSAFLVFSFYCMYIGLDIPCISRLGDHCSAWL